MRAKFLNLWSKNDFDNFNKSVSAKFGTSGIRKILTIQRICMR